jgi:cytochrome c553
MRAMIVLATLFVGSYTLAFAEGNGAIIGKAEAGQEKSALCVACHSVDGNSTDPQYPKIAGQHAEYSARHLKLFQSGERDNAVMAAIVTNLTAEDMADLGAYFATQKVSVGNADETVVARGQLLYRGGNAQSHLPSCMGCHGPTGRGNPASKYPAIGGQYADYTKLQLERFRAGTVYGKDENANNAIMSQVAKGLSDADIVALSEYLQGLHAAE